MINKDMHHMLVEAMKREDPIRMYSEFQEHFKGGKNHHVETARRMLNAHELGLEIERNLSKLLELIFISAYVSPCLYKIPSDLLSISHF